MKVLVIQGAGMNMRGKVDIELFGRMTLEQLNEQIRGYAKELGLEVEFCHSNIEGEVVNALYTAHGRHRRRHHQPRRLHAQHRSSADRYRSGPFLCSRSITPIQSRAESPRRRGRTVAGR
jgi:hypothetical protein